MTQPETNAPKTAVPRAPSPENQARLKYIVDATEATPGITSPTIAKALGITTLSCGQLADRLVKKGEIQLVKIEGGVRTYYPKGFDVSALPPAEPKQPKSGKPKAAAAPAPAEGDDGL